MNRKVEIVRKGKSIKSVVITDTNNQVPTKVRKHDLPLDMGKNLVKVINGMYHKMIEINATEGTLDFTEMKNFYGNSLKIVLRTKKR